MPEHFGKGNCRQISKELLERCEQLGLERVVAIIAPNNAASKKILSNNVLFPEKLCEIDGLPGEILAKEL
ncbi:hypothetical protein CHH83_03300 [Bacillus sp. 7586-K]|nr:hypothetical protein CHH83_03300 [Bacillus sp. 7586-K]